MTGEAWTGEPDNDTGTFAGFDWELKRNHEMGFWLGYVNVPYGHPWYGKEYDTLEDVAVHGGVTYAQHDGLEWRIGFDCGHAWDVSPKMSEILDPFMALAGSVERLQGSGPFQSTYKDIAFARGQAVRLCEQAAVAAVAQA